MFYSFPGRPFEEFPFQDSLLDNRFFQQALERRSVREYKNLGVDGSAHQPIVYRSRVRRGMDVGFHQFDLYRVSVDSLAFFRLNQPYTNLAYYQGAEQNNGFFTAQFSRNFANGVNFALDYKRMSQLSELVQFPNQQTRNTALAAGLQVQKRRYQAFAAFATNKTEQDEHGGIAEEPDRNDPFFTAGSADVFLNTAGTRHRISEYRYTHYLNLSVPRLPKPIPVPAPREPVAVDSTLYDDGRTDPAPDTTRQAPAFGFGRGAAPRFTSPPAREPEPAGEPVRQTFLVGHSLAYRTATFKFFDEQAGSAADYYGDFLVDDRGVRHFVRQRTLENHFRLITYQPDSTVAREARSFRSGLELGVLHQLHWVRQEPVDTTVNNLMLTGFWKVSPARGIALTVDGHFSLGSNAGDYRVHGELDMQLGKAWSFQALATNQLYSPNLIQRRFFVTQRQLWNNDFRKTLETNLEASVAHRKTGLRLTAGYHLLNQYIYFDTLGVARQTGVPVSIGQLMVQKNFRLGKFHLDNFLVFQTASEDVVRLPQWFGKHSLYFQGSLFKVLQTRIGVDLRYNSDYFSETFHPLTGNFRLQDEQEVLFYPSTDIYLGLRVTTFRAFFKWENISSLILTDRLFYQTAFYPYAPGSGFRLGIKWRFSN